METTGRGATLRTYVLEIVSGKNLFIFQFSFRRGGVSRARIRCSALTEKACNEIWRMDNMELYGGFVSETLREIRAKDATNFLLKPKRLMRTKNNNGDPGGGRV